ncbi:hypothetical protein B0H67DRAFT_499112 [Lasiosphaeris hirsuta]|uniref:Uncharacterized protein n=1 Tax=Lasiosphaeris hirsuta TaxID=260670 RepID=A0AA40DJ78_9PEZI|nr:hypothetical protein B0H67DRAFT_499112 [Lasiosphaeris hirsuta]
MVERPARSARRRPFSTLMKKLANLKASSGDGSRHASKRSSSKKRQSQNNNPYPESGRIGVGLPPQHSRPSISTGQSGRSSSVTSLGRGESVRLSADGHAPPTTGGRSMAPTVSTDHETSRSIMAPSHGASSLAGTSRTVNCAFDSSRRGGDSTFSSPAPSVRSLTTTLTTIQSMAPNGGTAAQNNYSTTGNNTNTQQSHQQAGGGGSQAIQFNQPFPTTSPASAIPSHLTPSGSSTTAHPTTYAMATANNLLTDNASILTLASSSKRRRRRSFDTDASVRALAPSSLWGGSRESLPLSVLSANMDGVPPPGGPTTPGLHRGTNAVGNERTSIYSATGILAAASERNSFYAKQTVGTAGDAASVRSGLLGHGRADSISGSVGGGLVSPLASPREVPSENQKERTERDQREKDVEEGDEESLRG